MPEVKKLWIVIDVPEDWNIFTDPAIHNEEHRLLHYCGALDEGGYSLDKFLRVFSGTGWEQWDKENPKVYDDGGSARKDAEKRLAKDKAKFLKKHPEMKAKLEKQASDSIADRVVDKTIASKVATRFARITQGE